MLAPGDVVASREYVSKADALARFKQTFGELAATMDGARRQPAAGVDRGAAAARSERRARPSTRSAARLREMPGVADVRYDRQWLDRLLSAIAVIRGVGLVLGVDADDRRGADGRQRRAAGAHARRDELEIMQLVGAPQAYIRGPFVMEGVLQGGVGALLALVALAAAFLALRGRYLVPLASAMNLSSIRFLPLELCLLLVVGGMVVGCLGGLVAAWNR